MKGFDKIALLFGLLGGLMAYFIIPLHFSRKRSLSPTDKAEFALAVDYYKSHCGPVVEETEERAKVYTHESGQDIWAGFDAMTQHGRPIIGSPTWCRYIGALWLKPPWRDLPVFGLTEQSVACIGVCRTSKRSSMPNGQELPS